MQASGSTGAVIVAPLPIRLTEARRDERISAVRWESPDDDPQLALAVRDLAS
jgi:hypothetical protein